MLKGSCLCGAITFTSTAVSRDPAACHCSQCRKQSGHYWASVQVMDDGLAILGTPTWYAASDGAKRGFCPTCGSFLFWKRSGDPDTAVALGAVDGATGLRLTRHIYTSDKGDYYDLPHDEGTKDV
tara:strand:- start:46857 stop:47231 length:375 start_codon:yes stop_codon:yes gene_type:complete